MARRWRVLTGRVRYGVGGRVPLIQHVMRSTGGPVLHCFSGWLVLCLASGFRWCFGDKPASDGGYKAVLTRFVPLLTGRRRWADRTLNTCVCDPVPTAANIDRDIDT